MRAKRKQIGLTEEEYKLVILAQKHYKKVYPFNVSKVQAVVFALRDSITSNSK